MTKKESKDKRMAEIIQAAVDEFLEKGYESASMEGIAKRAGISKGGLYYHFKSKDEILLLANQKLYQPIAEMRLEAGKKPNACHALSWYMKNYVDYWRAHKKEVIFASLSMAKMLELPALEKMYENYTEGYLSFFKNLYDRGVAEGEFRPHSTYESAMISMTALDGIVMYLVMDQKLDSDMVFSVFQKNLVEAYRLEGKPKKNIVKIK